MNSRYELELLEFRRMLSIDAPVLNTATLEFDNTIEQYKYTASWNRVTAAAQYRLEWGVDGLAFPFFLDVVALPFPVITYQEPLALPIFSGESRYYRVRAIAANSEVSAPSNVVYNLVSGQGAPVDRAEQLNVAFSDLTGHPTLSWPALQKAAKFIVNIWEFDSELGTHKWKPIEKIYVQTLGSPSPAPYEIITYTDTESRDFATGVEYMIEGYSRHPEFDPSDPKTVEFLFRSTGFVFAKDHAPLNENRGKVLLVVDDRFETLLATEIAQFKQDLIGDGWQIQGTEYVATDTDPASPTDTRPGVSIVKQKILDAHSASSGQLKSVVLIGHVPVPYSGTGNQGDGHSDHAGAWVADSYYGDLQSTGWVDGASTNIVTGLRDPENHNRPNDGKFDADRLPSALEFSVGRIDFARMHSFFPAGMSSAQAEAYLLAQYFERDHAYRLREFEVSREARIDSNFGTPGGDYWRFASTLFGGPQVKHQPWSAAVYGEEVISWMYAGGSGNSDLVAGATLTDEILAEADPINAVFHEFRGSWSGDWDKPPRSQSGYLDNIMNGMLADNGAGLAALWSGVSELDTGLRMHSMAVGATLGDSHLDSANGHLKYGAPFLLLPSFASRSILGDPTLRLHVATSQA